ncbi:MAG: hypothetical protein RLY31_2517 [Bacteroidota bacterium]|jgi:hypothetical protein
MKRQRFRRFRPYAFVWLPLFLLILPGSCTQPVKLLEKGRYDSAIQLCIRKLSGKRTKKETFVKTLETAFEKATRADMREIQSLEKEGRSENWVRINRIHQQIRRRQNAVEPLLPLVSSDGYQASFQFLRVEDLESDSREKAAEHFYQDGMRLLREASDGNKRAAVDAYRAFENIRQYYNPYRDEARQMELARELGTNHILFRMENDADVVLPADFEKELKRMSVRELNRAWQEFHLQPQEGLSYDYHVTMRIQSLQVSPEQVRERSYTDEKTVEDGWEYVLDDNGNVAKDSSGNDIKVPRKVRISAQLLEVYQHKAALVGGTLDFYDTMRRELIQTDPVAVEAVFENYAATFQGDKRALSEISRKRIGNKPLPFPSDEALLLQAADLLKPIVKDKISKSRIIRR